MMLDSRQPVRVVDTCVGHYDQNTIIERVIEAASSPGVDTFVGINADVCNRARKDTKLRSLLTSTQNYADGQSVVWASRFLGSPLPERLATTDIAEPLARAAARDAVPVYFLGAAPGIAESAAEQLRKRIPDLDVRTHHGYIDESSSPSILEDIHAHGTGILFVGMGDPRQQLWVDEHRGDLPPAVLTCGGLFDWISGRNPRAPGWMIRSGLEWLWRLGLEPRRLGRRYLVGNPEFLLSVANQRLRASRR